MSLNLMICKFVKLQLLHRSVTHDSFSIFWIPE